VFSDSGEDECKLVDSCRTVSLEDYNNCCVDLDNNDLVVMHLNCCSILSKYDSICVFLSSLAIQPDVFFF
jgi:hypothetical protein